MSVLEILTSAGTSAALLGIVVFLSRNLIVTRLKGSVTHEYDVKLEQVRAEGRETGERLRADLRRNEQRVDALRSGALSAMTSRQVSLAARRLQAVEELWTLASIELAPAKGLVLSMSLLNFDAIARRAQVEPQLREFAKTIYSGPDLKTISMSAYQKARVFLPAGVLATFALIQAIYLDASMRHTILVGGVDPHKIFNADGLHELLTSAAPEVLEGTTPGHLGIPVVLHRLEQRLLEQLADVLAGKEEDGAAVGRAAAIIKAAEGHSLALSEAAVTARQEPS